MDKYLEKCSRRCSKANENSEIEESNFFKDVSSHRSNSFSSSSLPARRISIGIDSSITDEKSQEFGELWNPLKESVISIYENEKPKIFFEELFRYVEELCDHNYSNVLYNKLNDLIDEYLHSQITKIYSSANEVNCDRNLFATKLNTFWLDMCGKTNLICHIFLILDRTFLLRDTALVSIMNLSFDLFSQNIRKEPKMLEYLMDEIFEMINKFRKSQDIDLSLLASLVRMLIDLQLYTRHFEPKLLEITIKFYQKEGETLSDNVSISEHIYHIASRISLEESMLSTFLSQLSTIKLLKIVRWELLGVHINSTFKKGLYYLIDENRENDLSLYYDLCLQVKSGEESLINILSSYIKVRVGEILSITLTTSADYEIKMIQSLINFHQKIKKIIKICFKDNALFNKAFNSTLNNILNNRSAKFVISLAKYIDIKMKESQKVHNELLEETLNEVISLLKLINTKDTFFLYFKNNLAQRLLSQKSASVNNEKSLITKIKGEFGHEMTSKLEGMFKDIFTSNEFSSSFNQTLTLNPNLESSILILTSAFWPTYPYYNLKYPSEIKERMLEYEKYYITPDKANRIIKWPLSISTCVVKCNFKNGCKEAQVNFLQALVLNLFNNGDSYKVDEISSNIGLNDDIEVQQVILSLTCGKFPLLLKEPPGLKVHLTDVLKYNENFTCRSYRIRISQVVMNDNSLDEAKISQQVSCDQECMLDACIVRVMKLTKIISHDVLIAEVLKRLKFIIPVSVIEKNILNLIQREYLKKSSDSPLTYSYIE